MDIGPVPPLILFILVSLGLAIACIQQLRYQGKPARGVLIGLLFSLGGVTLFAHVSHRDYIGDQLYQAVWKGKVLTVQRLLENGADPNYDFEGLDMLNLAASTSEATADQKTSMIAILRKAGARPRWH